MNVVEVLQNFMLWKLRSCFRNGSKARPKDFQSLSCAKSGNSFGLKLRYGNGWQQKWGNDESFFGSNLETSTDTGLGLDSDDNRDETGMTAREACCGCGGGNRNPDTFVESQDFPIYSNSPNFELTYPSEYQQVKYIRTK